MKILGVHIGIIIGLMIVILILILITIVLKHERRERDLLDDEINIHPFY